MDCAFGIQGNDYILLASDRSVMYSILKLQDSDEKILRLSENQLLAACGEIYDRKNFSKLVQANMEYYYYLNGNRLTTSEAAAYTRDLLAKGIRSNPYQCNVLVAGYDADGPKLFWLDYLGSMQQVTKGAHGYGAHFLYGLMDNCYKKDMTYQEGEECIRKCMAELKTRFLVNMVTFTVYKITKNGIEDVSAKFDKYMNNMNQ